MRPALTRTTRHGLSAWYDSGLKRSEGVLVAFSERGGGVSERPFSSLNLAAHVDDDPSHVDENRRLLLCALGIEDCRERLTCAEQVHGDSIITVDSTMAGAGAFAETGEPPVRSCDALITAHARVPLLLCFADCVPVVLVAPGPTIAVVHAGWRGALASLPGAAARRLAEEAACDPGSVRAYVGAHIGACHYTVGGEILSQFVNTFGTVARAESGGLDLGTVVYASLTGSGVDPCNIARLGTCTAEATDRYFSHRAEHGLTGRHGALACVLS